MVLFGFTKLGWLDYIFIVVTVISVLISIGRGFAREIVSSITWGVALWVSISYVSNWSHLLDDYVSSYSVRVAMVVLAIFLIVLLIGALLHYFSSNFIQKFSLGNVDRVLGFGFGLCRGVLLSSMMVVGLSMTFIESESWWQAAVLVPIIQKMNVEIKSMLPEKIQVYWPSRKTLTDLAQNSK